MEIKKYQIGKNYFEFVCETWENSRTWGHKVNLFKNGTEISKAKKTYINRTWEAYRYQSCMLKAIYMLTDEIKENVTSKYKSENNIARLTKKHKENIDKMLENNEDMQILNELEKNVKGNIW